MAPDETPIPEEMDPNITEPGTGSDSDPAEEPGTGSDPVEEPVSEGESTEPEINIIPHTNPGMKPYEDRSKFTNYIFDGTSIVEVTGSIVTMVSDEDELTDLVLVCKPGTIAYLAGWQEAWQLDTDGSTWVQFIGGGE